MIKTTEDVMNHLLELTSRMEMIYQKNFMMICIVANR
jgi:hypothetical protein